MPVLVVDHRPRQLAAVQHVRPVVRQQLDRARQLLLHDHVALPDVAAARGEDRRGLRRAGQDRPDRVEHRLLPVVRGHASRRRRGRRPHQLSPRQPPVPAVRRVQPRHHSRHRAGRRPDMEHLRGPLVERHQHVLDLDQPPSCRQIPAGDGRERVQQRRLPPRRPHHHEAAAARPGQRRLRRPRHRARRDHRVHSGASGLQRRRTGTRRQLVACGDRSPRHRAAPTPAGSWAARAGRSAAVPADARREPRRPEIPRTRSPWPRPSPTSARPAARPPMRRR